MPLANPRAMRRRREKSRDTVNSSLFLLEIPGKYARRWKIDTWTLVSYI
jgi:hypothetical protein